MRKRPGSVYKWNISEVICDTDIARFRVKVRV
jgi:hypothetical protein